jgi:hypothetical protein
VKIKIDQDKVYFFFFFAKDEKNGDPLYHETSASVYIHLLCSIYHPSIVLHLSPIYRAPFIPHLLCTDNKPLCISTFFHSFRSQGEIEQLTVSEESGAVSEQCSSNRVPYYDNQNGNRGDDKEEDEEEEEEDEEEEGGVMPKRDEWEGNKDSSNDIDIAEEEEDNIEGKETLSGDATLSK